MAPGFGGDGHRSHRSAHADPGRESASVAASTSVSSLPRTPDDRPNLNGIWQVLTTASWDIQDHPAQKGVPAGQGVVEGNDIPYQPWALAKKQENFKNRLTGDLVEARGFLPGVPRIMYMPLPFQIVQTPKYVTMVYEYGHAVRVIYTDGSKHPEGPIEFWLGDSRGSLGRGHAGQSTSSISTPRPGSTKWAISTARPCTWSNALRWSGRTTSTTKSRSRTRRCSRDRGR